MRAAIGGYLYPTRDYGITYQKGTSLPNTLIGFVDTDRARSVVFLVIFLNGGPVYWRCKMLDRPTASTGETEHQGLFLLAKELLYKPLLAGSSAMAPLTTLLPCH